MLLIALLQIFAYITLSNFNTVMAQMTYKKLGVMETYVLRVHIDTILYQSKCGCQAIQKKDKFCKLYNIKVLDAVFMGDSSVYKDAEDLKRKVSYLVISNRSKLASNMDYHITASNSTNKEGIILIRSLDAIVKDEKYYYTYAHAIGLRGCSSKNEKFFNKLLKINSH